MKRLDIEVIGRLELKILSFIGKMQIILETDTHDDNFENHCLVNLHELLVPLNQLSRCRFSVEEAVVPTIIMASGGQTVALMVMTPLEDFPKYQLSHLCIVNLSANILTKYMEERITYAWERDILTRDYLITEQGTELLDEN